MITDYIHKQLKKATELISNATVVCTFITSIFAFLLMYYKVLVIQFYIPLWAFILSVSFPFTCWWLIRYRLSTRKRKYKTGDIIQVLGDSRPFIVFTYYFWYPSYLKLKEKDGDCIIAVHQKYISEYINYEDDSTRLSFLPQSCLPPKIKNKEIPSVAVKITKL